MTGSSSATEVSAASDSVLWSSSHIPLPVQTEGSGTLVLFVPQCQIILQNFDKNVNCKYILVRETGTFY